MLPRGPAVEGLSSVPVVSLRAVEDDDLPLFFQWQADEESCRLPAVAARDAEAFAAHWSRIRSDAGTNLRTIVADGVVAGHAVGWAGGDGRMVGYWIGKAHWGRSIASSALRLFDDDERHRPLPATVAEHNVGSRRVLEKAGFRHVARKLVADGPEPGMFAELRFRLG